jgi:hypothetical protein
MQYYLSQLSAEQAIERLEVHSFEMSVYLVKLTIAGKDGYVYAKPERIQRFSSTQHIRDAFAQCVVKEAVLVHDSPYDEMIGNPPKTSRSVDLPFAMHSAVM